jgi:hypothetical protein
MKRFILYILTLSVFLSGCEVISQKNSTPPSSTDIVKEVKKEVNKELKEASSKDDEKVRAVNIVYNKDFNISNFNSYGFNTIFLSTDGIRIANGNYKTDNKVLKKLESSIRKLENQKTNYIINITSGPGFSSDGKIVSIFDNRQEAMYFAKMTKEIIKRHYNSKYFKGISIDLNNIEVPEDKYYSTLDYIISKVKKDYSKVPIVLNLHPLSFENGFNNIPEIKYTNIILNAPISLKGISYPGYGAGYKSSIKLTKNTILDRLQKLKDVQDENKADVIVTIKAPWVAKSEVLIQDIFEVTKILGYDFNLSFGNSSDMFDITQNKGILKIVKRHSI